MLTYLFPGQGSQMRGMGANLFADFPDIIAQADEILGYSVKSLCLEDPLQQLHQTQYTQPAIYIVNALTYLKKLQEKNQKPDFVAGHSLGEYNALLAAEVFDFTTGLKLVKKRGELMSQATDGGMAAVIGLQPDALKEILIQNHLGNITIANYNSYIQLVISGSKNDIERTRIVFENLATASLIPLNVSGAFHSAYMLAAQDQFAEFLNAFEFAVPTIPVLANLNAKPYHPAVIQTNLAKQLTYSVQWTNSIEYLIAQDDMTFEEIGSGNVLIKLAQRIRNGQ